MKATVLFAVALAAGLARAPADTIAQWNFNSVPPDGSVTTGTNVPSLGAGTASLVGGTTATFSTGSPTDPASSADDSGWNTSDYPSQSTGNKTAGVQFNVSTLGYSNIVVRWDHRVSGSASKYFRLQYSADGGTFTDYPTPIAMLSSPSTASYYEPQTNSLAAVAAVNNNANFAFRVVSEFENSATGTGSAGYVTVSNTTYSGGQGTVRFDYVTISGTPIPGVNTAPTITGVAGQTIRLNQSTGPLPFTISDAEDPPGSLTLSKASSDLSVIPLANIVFDGSGSSRTVTITAGSQTGSSVITLYVIDTGGRSNSTAFTVTVLPLNTAPVISSLSFTNTLLNTPTPAINFIVSDLETPAGSLTVSGVSSNTGLVPNGNIVFGGSGANRTVIVTPATGQTGVTPIAITVSDGTNTATSVFPLMVTPSASVIFQDPFAYPNGSLLTNSAFLWDNRSGTFGQCQVTNGQLQITSAQTEDVIGPLIGAPYAHTNGTVLYASFKITLLTLPKVVPGHFAHFANGSTLRGRIYAGTTNAASGSFRFFVSNASDTNTVLLAADLNTNTPYTLVTRYNVDNPSTTLWLNPSLESDAGVAATDTQTATSIVSYDFRQDSDIGATMLIDDLKAGLSFAALTGTANMVSPIPLVLRRVGNQAVLT